jgi:O6-methylguanine-DNA--protein-cysteine methyltransferase
MSLPGALENLGRLLGACHHACMVLWHYELNTPMGPMRAAFDSRGRLRELVLEGLDPRKTSPLPPKEQREAKRFLDRQLEAYLAGTLRTFTVPLDPQGTFPELRVWDAVCGISYAQSRQPSELAARLRLDEDVVVMACAASPIALLIPAHRVVLPGEGPLPKALRDLESGLGWRKP